MPRGTGELGRPANRHPAGITTALGRILGTLRAASGNHRLPARLRLDRPRARAARAGGGAPQGVVRVELDARIGHLGLAIPRWNSRPPRRRLLELRARQHRPSLSRRRRYPPPAPHRHRAITTSTSVASTTDELRDTGTLDFGLSLGLTRAITIFGRLPLVRARAQGTIALDPTSADAGVNPGAAPRPVSSRSSTRALDALSTKISSGAYTGADPRARPVHPHFR